MMAAAEERLAGRIADAIAVVPAADLKTDAEAIAAVRIAQVYPSSHPLPGRLLGRGGERGDGDVERAYRR